MNVAGYLAGDCKTISHLPIRKVCDIAALPDASRIEVMGTVIYPAIPPVIARAGFCLRVPSRTSRYPVDVTSGCPFWRRLHGYRTPRKYLLLLAPLRVRASHDPPTYPIETKETPCLAGALAVPGLQCWLQSGLRMAGRIRHLVNRSGRNHARLVVTKDVRGIVGKTELRTALAVNSQ